MALWKGKKWNDVSAIDRAAVFYAHEQRKEGRFLAYSCEGTFIYIFEQ